MFPAFAHVPVYPLVFVVFWGSAAIFILVIARHLRVFAPLLISNCNTSNLMTFQKNPTHFHQHCLKALRL